jgi:hypothetical protein
VASTPQDRANAFLAFLLEKGTSLPDQQEQGPANPPLAPLGILTKEDCWAALCAPAPSAPGEDGLATSVWREIWPVAGDLITSLYCQCLKEGRFPKAFKSAKVVMILKPGKRDLSQLKSYRPISLLSTLGKGLERFTARRIAARAINASLLSSCHFGALPGCSAIDLVQVLVHRVEKALSQGRVASLLLLDVKGAFDAVDHQRLLSHLRLQGWDPSLISWVRDWLSSRSVSIQIEEATASSQIKGGLPQGSPLSPVLFLLYAARVVSANKNSFCYADDLGLLFVGDSLEETTCHLTKAYQSLSDIGSSSGLPFSADKTEVQHFSRRRKGSLPTVTLPGKGEIPPSPYT